MTVQTVDSILLAEDDRIDAKAFVRTVRLLGFAAEVTVAKDGIEAWELLEGATALQPGIIVLDINMPRMSGLELLAKIRASERLRKTPVFVLTTSDASGDRRAADDFDVAGYIIKSDLHGGLRCAFQRALPAA
ncbi:MAG: response regulator [Gammaproteobacteria bacterium]|nr:response regulator [Gammaproteobacteria bacterium]